MPASTVLPSRVFGQPYLLRAGDTMFFVHGLPDHTYCLFMGEEGSDCLTSIPTQPRETDRALRVICPMGELTIPSDRDARPVLYRDADCNHPTLLDELPLGAYDIKLSHNQVTVRKR